MEVADLSDERAQEVDPRVWGGVRMGPLPGLTVAEGWGDTQAIPPHRSETTTWKWCTAARAKAERGRAGSYPLRPLVSRSARTAFSISISRSNDFCRAAML